MRGCGVKLKYVMEHSKKRRHSKKAQKEYDVEESQVVDETDLIAMGTIGGNVLLYSMLQGDLKSRLERGHEDTVNDVCWHRLEDTLYSCGDDGNIVEWDLSSNTPKSKWKADKHSVHSLAVCPSSHALLSGGRTIKLWNLKDKEQLQQFSGHASPVTTLLFLHRNLYPKETDSSNDAVKSTQGLHFLSASQNERVINFWQVKSKYKNKTPVASLMLPHEPLHVDISQPGQGEKVIKVAAVTKDGCVQIFSLLLNGHAKEPFQPSQVIQVATPGHKAVTPRRINIIAAQFSKTMQDKLLLGYGSSFKSAFESMALESDQKEVCLIRDDPSMSKPRPDSSGDKVSRPGAAEDATVLTPHSSAPLRPALATDREKSVRSKRKAEKPEVSLEDKLNAISLAQTQSGSGKTEQPNLNSMVTLLTQALQSQDKNLLLKVLTQTKVQLIQRTVHRLPVVLVEPLIQELARRLDQTPESAIVTTIWTKMVLKEKASYLTSCPGLVKMISEIYEKISARTHAGQKLNRLQGKLDLMLSQISSQSTEEDDSYNSALLVYEDDSDEEDNLLDNMPAMTSESEVDWEEEEDDDDDSGDGGEDGSDMEMDDGPPEDKVEQNGKDEDDESSEEESSEDSDDDDEK
ncbi:putative WD repeat-containing protein 43 [Apostichopus japonicus]|uniref:Putative WD repeat-containing protein 43 n=1 Tax=Stichopus japonicus TaxID=307972 RepID=A0A2G8K549_STIJA|nr:putative WD repeat-containing protein 43 [Apostichopus japonicus]